MVFFGKNEAVIKIKGMCCFFVVLNVAIVVVGVTLIFFVWVFCNCIYVCLFFFVSDFCSSSSLANIMERAGARGCTVYYTWLLLEGYWWSAFEKKISQVGCFLVHSVNIEVLFNF